MDEHESELHWLPAGSANNPFDVEVLDCRPVSLRMTAMSKSEAVAARFCELRGQDGRRLVGTLPQDHSQLDTSLWLPYTGDPFEGPVYLSAQMEDKWDLFVHEQVLYATRSWTGDLAYVVDLEYDTGRLLLSRIRHARGLTYGERGMAELQVAFLVVTYMFGELAPFPVPTAVPRDSKQIAMYGFMCYGRAAQFGAFEGAIRRSPLQASYGRHDGDWHRERG
jgi:hypothetical protein